MKNNTEEWFPEYVPTGFVAKYFGVSNTTVLRWIADGILAAFKLPGGQNRIHRDVLRDFIDRNNQMNAKNTILKNSQTQTGEKGANKADSKAD